MRKFAITFLALVFTLTFLAPKNAQAEIPAKARVFLTAVGYGTASGAILGASSMAFGNSTRAVAQGASLGLYAGILFGTYVIVSHNQRRQGKYEDNADSPYQDTRDIYGDEYNSEDGGASEGDESRGGFFDRIQTMQVKFQSQNKRGGQMPPLYLNLINYQF